MKKARFDDLVDSASERLEQSRDKRDVRTTPLHRPPKPLSARDIQRLRLSLHASQAVFADLLNVSTKLVQSWEGGRRAPVGPALLLLHIAAAKPGVIQAVRQLAQSKPQTGGHKPQVASLKL